MVSFGITELRKRMKDCIGRVEYGGERIAIEHHGKPVCVLISMEDLKLLEAIEDHADIQAALKARDEESVNWDEIKQEFGL